MRQVVIYPGEDGYWVAECPSLPGCISQGTTREEAIANIRDAIRLYIATLEGDKLAGSRRAIRNPRAVASSGAASFFCGLPFLQ